MNFFQQELEKIFDMMDDLIFKDSFGGVTFIGNNVYVKLRNVSFRFYFTDSWRKDCFDSIQMSAVSIHGGVLDKALIRIVDITGKVPFTGTNPDYLRDGYVPSIEQNGKGGYSWHACRLEEKHYRKIVSAIINYINIFYDPKN